MEAWWQIFQSPEGIIQAGGLTLIFLIIFAESGTPVGVFMPGESLLFVAGVACQLENLQHSVYTLLVVCWLAAMSGSLFGYYTGAKSRYRLIRKPDTRFFRRRHFAQARLWFRNYRSGALLIGRFFPVIRTLLPIFAGIVRMHFGHFFLYTFGGVTVWVLLFVLLGYWCGDVFPEIKNYLGYALVSVIVISLAPLFRKLGSFWRRARA